MKKRSINAIFAIALVAVMMTTCFIMYGVGNVNAAVVEEKVKYHFLNVNSIEKESGGPIGSADCIIIEDNVGENRVITLVDTGYNDAGSWNKVVDYCNDLEIETIDNLIITHPHNDHHGGVPELCKNFDITRCYYTLPADWSKVRPQEMDWASKATSDWAMQALLEKINSDGTGVDMISPDEEGKYYPISDESGFTVYNCLAVVKNNYREPEFNDFSMIIKYTYGEVDALLTADINIQYEYVLTGQVDKDGNRVAQGSADAIAPVGEIEIFKLPHHGTEGSLSTDAFFSAMNPYNKSFFAVITGYRANIGVSTIPRCNNHGYDVKVTHDGDIRVWTDGTSFAWEQDTL